MFAAESHNWVSGREKDVGGGPFDSGIDVSGASLFSQWHAWHPAGSTLPEGVLDSSSWKMKTSTPFMHVGWSDSGPVSTWVGANVSDDHSRAQRVPAPERNFQPAGWRHTITSAGNHDTLQSVAVPRRMSPAPHGWHERHQFASGVTVAEDVSNPCW